MRGRMWVMAGVVLWLVGCGGGPTRPMVAAAGSWSGTLTDATRGPGTFQMTVDNPSGTQLVGTWSATIGGQSIQGTASGSAAATPHLLNLSCTGGGIGNLAMTVNEARISGTYFFFGPTPCVPLDEGSVDLARQ